MLRFKGLDKKHPTFQIGDKMYIGYLKENPQDGKFAITAKSEQTIRQKSLEEIFGKLKTTHLRPIQLD